MNYYSLNCKIKLRLNVPIFLLFLYATKIPFIVLEKSLSLYFGKKKMLLKK